jgi:hypothetical protein
MSRIKSIKVKYHINDKLDKLNAQQWLDLTYRENSPTRHWAICADGFSISIQASHYHYCSPQVDYTDCYGLVEICAEKSLPTLSKYHDGYGIYGFVPIEMVDRILRRHGWIVGTAIST